jgi:hypothetical protein
MPDPGLDTRQHERPVNKRRQRIRKRKAGSQAEPEAFRPYLRPDSIEPENGPQAAEVKECEGYARPRTQRWRQLKRGLNLGRRNVGSPLSTLLEVSPVVLCAIAIKRAAGRLVGSGRLVAPRRGFFIIVPLEYKTAGGLPPSWFIDEFMRFHQQPYYVGPHGSGFQPVLHSNGGRNG